MKWDHTADLLQLQLQQQFSGSFVLEDENTLELEEDVSDAPQQRQQHEEQESLHQDDPSTAIFTLLRPDAHMRLII
jgi:hypothetical protein